MLNLVDMIKDILYQSNLKTPPRYRPEAEPRLDTWKYQRQPNWYRKGETMWTPGPKRTPLPETVPTKGPVIQNDFGAPLKYEENILQFEDGSSGPGRQRIDQGMYGTWLKSQYPENRQRMY